jgi:anti-sigma regulatory factor (Ser/Thr protein kinase)
VGLLELRVGQVEDLAFVRHALDEWLNGQGMSEPPRAEFVLATHEALANAIQHSGISNSVTVRARAASEGIEIVISDEGSWKAPDEVPNDERGRGLSLIRLLVPDAEVRTGGSGTTVRLGHLFTGKGTADGAS